MKMKAIIVILILIYLSFLFYSSRKNKSAKSCDDEVSRAIQYAKLIANEEVSRKIARDLRRNQEKQQLCKDGILKYLIKKGVL